MESSFTLEDLHWLVRTQLNELPVSASAVVESLCGSYPVERSEAVAAFLDVVADEGLVYRADGTVAYPEGASLAVHREPLEQVNP